MRDAGAVGAVERVGDLDGEFNGLVEGERSFLDSRGERLALDQLHPHVGRPDVVKDADVRMVQRRHGSRRAM